MDQYILDSERVADEITKAYYKASKRIESQMVRTIQGLSALSDSKTAIKALIQDPDAKVLKSLRKAVSTLPEGKEKQEALTLLSSPAYQFRLRRLQATIDNARKECEKLYKVELKDTTRSLRQCYNSAFAHTIYDIDRGFNTLHTFSMFPASRVNKLLRSRWSGENYSDRIWNSTNKLAASLKEQLLVSFMTGSGVTEAAAAIREEFQVSAHAARRLVRTETNFIANQSELDAYKRLGIEEYRYIATLDTRTSDICQSLDNRVFKIDDAKAGVNLPPMHPNCRSTTIMHDAEEPLKERIAKDENGKSIYVPGNMSYKQWLQKYHPELVDKLGESGIIKSITLDDFELRTYGVGLTEEVENKIWKEIKALQSATNVYFDDVFFKSSEDMRELKSAIETEMIDTGKIVININKNLFAGFTLEEVDMMFQNADSILSNSLHEAMIHERGHVKTMRGKTASEVTESFKKLKEIHIAGVSDYAAKDGAECIAEVEVLLERGEKVPDEAMKLYNEYVKG